METQKMKLRTYGHGNTLDITKIQPIHNNKWVKPDGGLWASPINSKCGWYKWCKEENFGDLTTVFEFKIDGIVFIIDSLDDAKRLPWIKSDYQTFPDFEEMVKQGFDAIWLTEDGQWKTRLSTPDLYGWDCECVLVLNPQSIVI